MIKIDEGLISFSGHTFDLMAEFCLIAKELIQQTNITQKDLHHCVDIACENEEELEARAEQILEQLSKELFDVMSGMVAIAKNDTEEATTSSINDDVAERLFKEIFNEKE